MIIDNNIFLTWRKAHPGYKVAYGLNPRDLSVELTLYKGPKKLSINIPQQKLLEESQLTLYVFLNEQLDAMLQILEESTS